MQGQTAKCIFAKCKKKTNCKANPREKEEIEKICVWEFTEKAKSSDRESTNRSGIICGEERVNTIRMDPSGLIGGRDGAES